MKATTTEYQVAYKGEKGWADWQPIEKSTVHRRLRANYGEHLPVALQELEEGREIRTAFAKYRAIEP